MLAVPLARLVRVLLTTAFALALVAAASAQTASKSTPAHSVVAGQTVAIDKATGKLRQPTPEEAKVLAAGIAKLTSRSTDGLVVKHHPNGSKSIDLQGRFQSVSVAKVDANGNVDETCVTNTKQAEDFLTAKLAASKRNKFTQRAEVK
jgi:hypothetical protein